MTRLLELSYFQCYLIRQLFFFVKAHELSKKLPFFATQVHQAPCLLLATRDPSDLGTTDIVPVGLLSLAKGGTRDAISKALSAPSGVYCHLKNTFKNSLAILMDKDKARAANAIELPEVSFLAKARLPGKHCHGAGLRYARLSHARRGPKILAIGPNTHIQATKVTVSGLPLCID